MEEAKAVFDNQEDIEVDGHVLHITYKSPKLREKGEAKEMHRRISMPYMVLQLIIVQGFI